MNRKLKKHDRNYVFIRDGGKCKICGRELEDDWHADHVVPFCVSGRTMLSEMQATCAKCNLKKGKNMLRKHQREFKELCESIAKEYCETGVLRTDKIVCSVFPGGGKSVLPIIALKIFKDAGIVDKLLWVVPRTSLKVQGAQEFEKPYLKSIFPHNLEIRECGTSNDLNPTRGTDGFLTTYQALQTAKANNPDRENCNEHELDKHRYLLFLDECQHATPSRQDKDGYGYYKAIKPLFEKAKFAVLGSGTLYRNQNEEVAFIDYVDDVDDLGLPQRIPQIDIEYNIEDATRDKAIIQVVWEPYSAAEVKYTLNGKDMISDCIQNNQELGVALDTEYGEKLVDVGVQTWLKWKQTDKRSKLIILGHKIPHCNRICEQLNSMGLRPLLAVSKPRGRGAKAKDSHLLPANPHKNIEEFRLKNGPGYDILVTCQMAYEGLDCKQATHLIVANRIRSTPWLMQAFTRVMRYDSQGAEYEKQYGCIIVPDDPMMKKIITEELKNPQLAITDLMDDLLSGIEGKGLGEFDVPIIENPSSKMGERSQLNLDGDELSSEMLMKIQMFQVENGLIQPESLTWKMLKNLGRESILEGYMTTKSATVVDEEKLLTPRQREVQLKQKIQKLCGRLDYKFQVKNGTWNKKVFKQFRSRQDMTEAELKDAYLWIQKEVKEQIANPQSSIGKNLVKV